MPAQLRCHYRRKNSQFSLTYGLHLLAGYHQQYLQHLWLYWSPEPAEGASHRLLCLQCGADDCCISLLC